MDDRELMAQYRRDGSERAFRALVERHLALVYSAGLRQVRSPDLAKDVAQEVFLDLARQLHRGTMPGPLAPWLLVVTRRRAVDLIRRETRRRRREQEAVAQSLDVGGAHWDAIAPKIDQALTGLGKGDREAVVRRYFQQQSFAEIAVGFGGTEAAAQKRVSRAMERLRAALFRLGITAAATFETELFSQSVQIAPAGMAPVVAAQIRSLAKPGAGAIGSWLQRLTHSLAGHATVGALAIASVAAGWHEVRLDFQQHKRLAAWQTRLAADRDALRQWEATRTKQEKTRGEVDALRMQARKIYADTERLRTWFDQNPELILPEYTDLSGQDWVRFAYKTPGLAATKDPGGIALQFRTEIRGQTEKRIQAAMGAYFAAKVGPLANLNQLRPYLGDIPDDVLAEFALVAHGSDLWGTLPGGPYVVSAPLLVYLSSPGTPREAFQWTVMNEHLISVDTDFEPNLHWP